MEEGAAVCSLVLPHICRQDVASLRLCCRAWHVAVDSAAAGSISVRSKLPRRLGAGPAAGLLKRLSGHLTLCDPAEPAAQACVLAGGRADACGLLQQCSGLRSLNLHSRRLATADLEQISALLPQLTALTILQFPFTQRSAYSGLGSGLVRLRLQSTKVSGVHDSPGQMDVRRASTRPDRPGSSPPCLEVPTLWRAACQCAGWLSGWWCKV
jgi:hypothetical protein